MIHLIKGKYNKGDVYINPKYIGAKFNRWTLISFSHKEKYGGNKERQFWLCRCDCGKEKIMFPDSIIRGRSKSCGCLYKEIKKASRMPIRDASINSKYSMYKHVAKKRNISFELTRDEFDKFTHGNCFYCNEKPNERRFTNKKVSSKRVWIYNMNGVDRVDSSLGYTINNCVSCCTQCNRAKMEHSSENFKQWIIKVYNNFIIKGAA